MVMSSGSASGQEPEVGRLRAVDPSNTLTGKSDSGRESEVPGPDRGLPAA